MFKRAICFLSAVMVAASSAFAWDAYSFTGVYDAPSIPNLVLANTSSNSLIDYQTFWSWVNSYVFNPNIFYAATFGGSGGIPSSSVDMPLDGFTYTPLPWMLDGNNSRYYSSSNNVPAPENDSVFTYHSYSVPYAGECALVLDFSIPAEYSLSSVSLSGSLRSGYHIKSPIDAWVYFSHLEIYVNDNLAYSSGLSWDTSLNSISLNDFIFTASSSITSVRFKFYNSNQFFDGDYDSSAVWQLDPFVDFLDFSASFLDDLTVLDGHTGEAQGNLNDLDNIESEWTGSMTSNFDALDLGNFSFPSGLVSGFALITGIFQDLWNGMGEYKILFVFPLTLGIVLLLIGRISKFSGGQSSRQSDRGDGDA